MTQKKEGKKSENEKGTSRLLGRGLGKEREKDLVTHQGPQGGKTDLRKPSKVSAEIKGMRRAPRARRGRQKTVRKKGTGSEKEVCSSNIFRMLNLPRGTRRMPRGRKKAKVGRRNVASQHKKDTGVKRVPS